MTNLGKETEMKKCTCTGPLCSCGADGVVKDGAGVVVSASMMDAANDTSAWPKAVFDAAGVHCNNVTPIDPTPIVANDEAAKRLEDEEVRRCQDGQALWAGAVARFNSERSAA